MCAIWGTTWYGIKVSLATLPPVTGVGLRFVVAGVLLFVVAALARKPLQPSRVPWKLVLVLAATFFGANYVLTYFAETHLASGLVAVLFGTLIFFTFGFAHMLAGERSTPAMWAGAILAFAGVAVISLAQGAQGALVYVFCAIGAAAVSAFGNAYAKRHSAKDPLVTLPYAMLIAGLVLFAAGNLFEQHGPEAYSLRSWLAVLYLAVLGSSVAFYLNLWLLKHVAAWIVALSALIIPVIAVFVGIVVGGESFTPRDLLGAALVIVGVWIALAREVREERYSAPAS